jgi:hypothetical protein
MLSTPQRDVAENDERPAVQGFRSCAEEDSNLHPVIPDQALDLVTRVSHRPDRARSSLSSGSADETDASEDLDLATDVATAGRPNVASTFGASHVSAVPQADDPGAHG